MTNKVLTEDEVKSVIVEKIDNALEKQRNLYNNGDHNNVGTKLDLLAYLVEHIQGSKRFVYTMPCYSEELQYLQYAKSVHRKVKEYLRKELRFLNTLTVAEVQQNG